MQSHRILLAFLAITLLSCSKTPEPAAPAAPPPAGPSGQQPSPPAAPQPSPAASEPAGIPLLSAALLEGTDYLLIPNGVPLQGVAGKIEVVELFNYACPACNTFEPKMARWKKSLPGDVRVTYAALDFRPDFVPYARAYYAADTLGLVEKTHEAVYDAIHQLHTLPGEGQPADEDVIAKFYGQYGADPAKFRELMDSFGVNAKIAAARQFAARSRVTGTPSLVVDGKYLVRGDTFDRLLENATQVIAKAREAPH